MLAVEEVEHIKEELVLLVVLEEGVLLRLTELQILAVAAAEVAIMIILLTVEMVVQVL